ncbi:sensor histidine kinase [Streptomyces roseolilacinus]|uniref:histidine kinase n=1 Tax=Streptomyces roseolilacinus TaxID=66904 RepID=A0A918AUR9_9ACTN|nr:sensor histidine kinase [Streptomyces roseolilacinus]GGP88074.1 histidine kinase [Streptomyces roseolilacinus]
MESTAGRDLPAWATGALPVAAALGAGLSVRSDWWVLPTAAAAFLAGRRPGGTWPGALALGALLVTGTLAVLLVPSWFAHATTLVGVVVAGGMLPWFAGRFWWQYRELVRAGWERAAHLEREQRLVAEQARLRERARIAQDMHDLLGHDLSLIALSAGALQLAPGLAGEHRATARDIRVRAGAAVERLGEVVGLLREEGAGPEPSPDGSPDAGLARLVGAAAASGLAVELDVEGAAPAAGDGTAGEGLPPVVARAAHRVAQEALTNVAKHAPGATATVRLVHGDGRTEVRVENGPAPRARPGAPSGGGRGLIGLDERVRLAGGTLRYGPRDGGFAVTAVLPHTAPVRAPELAADRAAPARAPLPQEHRRARRRAGRALVALAVVPVATGAALTAALVGWEAATAPRAVLDPGAYARLRIGQDRAEVARLLPERQLVSRPTAPEPEGEGITCEYYAVTADRFDDRSGDAYRLCFRDGALWSRDVVTP